MIDQYQQKATLKELFQWTMLPRSSFYYKPSGGKRGISPSTQTVMIDGSMIPNTEVVDKIRSILSGEFVCYGYHKVTMQLRQEDFIINRKKVYRLMNENNLLLGKTIKTTGKRE